MAGRKPLPANVHLLHGNPSKKGKDRAGADGARADRHAGVPAAAGAGRTHEGRTCPQNQASVPPLLPPHAPGFMHTSADARGRCLPVLIGK